MCAEMRAQREALDKAMRRFIDQKMYAAWNQWRSWGAQVHRQQKMTGGAVRRMIYRKLPMAWKKRQCEYEQLKFV